MLIIPFDVCLYLLISEALTQLTSAWYIIYPVMFITCILCSLIVVFALFITTMLLVATESRTFNKIPLDFKGPVLLIIAFLAQTPGLLLILLFRDYYF